MDAGKKDIYRTDEPPLLVRRRPAYSGLNPSSAYQRAEHSAFPRPHPEPRARVRRRRGEHNSTVVGLNKLMWLGLLALVGVYGIFLIYANRKGLFLAKPPPPPPVEVPAVAPTPAIAGPVFLDVPIESDIKNWKRALGLTRDGVVQLEAGKIAVAAERLQQAVELAPDLLVAREELARFWERERNYPNAEREWRAVLARDPEKSAARIRLAAVYLAAGQNESALDAARWALETDPYAKEALDIAASALLALRQPQEAVGFLRRLVAIDRDDPSVRNKLGLAYLSLNDLKNAESTFRDVLRMDAANSVAYYNLAVTCARRDAAADAVDLLMEASRRFGVPFVLAWTKSADFDPIREHPAFRAFIEQSTATPETVAVAAP